MIGQRYNDKKTAVLDVCRRYLRLRGDTEDGVDADFLKNRMKALEDGRYILAVVGEVKAGKSTLINALLGESILPTDVLQSSSAVIEIFKSAKKYIEVQYADGRVEKKKMKDDPDTLDRDEAVQHLKDIGAIQDRYRDIPTTLIDACIVEGSIAPGFPLPIADLEAASKLSLHDNEAMIREYVDGRTPSDIPQKITLGFPLKYAFNGLRLVDSPGVGSLGGIQDTTYAYIQNANAVLFVHSLESPIESSSFSDFVDNVVPERNLETLFLMLTKSGMKSKIEINEKIREARKQYHKKFDQDRILHVDSMLKIVSDEIEKFDSAASLKEHYRKQKKYLEEVYVSEQDQGQELRDEAIKFDFKLRLLNKILDDIGGDSDRETIQAALRKSSNFDEMERMIDEFSNRAPELQLSDLLESVKSGYDAQNQDLDQVISMLEEKRKHPQTFESEISNYQNLLKDYRLLMNKCAEKIYGQYTGIHAFHNESLHEITSKYQNEIDQASALNRIKKALIDYHEEMDSFADKVGAKIKLDLEEKMKKLKGEFKTKHGITVPAIDVQGIEAKTKTEAYSTVTVERDPDGIGEWCLKILTLGIKSFHESKEVYDKSEHLRRYKLDARNAVQEKMIEFEKLVEFFIDNIVPDFQSALKIRIDALNQELEDIKTKKEANEEILEEIKKKQNRKKRIAAELVRVSDGLENLP